MNPFELIVTVFETYDQGRYIEEFGYINLHKSLSS